MLGSSPRVWGQVYNFNPILIDADIIPTRMGTSDGDITNGEADEDHPHAYGDKKGEKKNDRQNEGSSPRVWGQVFLFR